MSDMDSKLDQAKGKVKQAAGDLTDNVDLKREGKIDEASGNAKGVRIINIQSIPLRLTRKIPINHLRMQQILLNNSPLPS